MILRKPYAFFIKYFRLLNLAMAALTCFLIYRTLTVTSFFNKYVVNYIDATNDFVVGHYINMYNFFVPVLLIIITVTVLSVMIVKQKPKKLYIFNLVTFILTIIMFSLDYMVLRSLYDTILDVRLSKGLRDVSYILLGFQVASLVLTLIRATGFDIKGFNFSADLQQLNIDAKDSEEFEVAINFDTNKAHRDIRYKLRNLYYMYAEHRFIVNTIAIILAIIIVFAILMNIGVYSAYYKENDTVYASNFVFSVRNSYVITTDGDGKEITSDTALIVTKFDIKSEYEDSDFKLNTGLITLRVGNKSYGQTRKYNPDLEDIGTSYIDQNLSTEFSSYILAFEIPKSATKYALQLKINDEVSYVKGEMGALNNYVKLKPKDLTEHKKNITKKIGNELSFEGSLLGNSNFIINNYSIDDKFKINYNFCYNKGKCYASYEYVTPTATGNYHKSLMKIDGEFEADNIANIDNVSNLYYFLNKYGVIHYQLGNKWYFNRISSQVIKPTVGKDNSYYIEVNRDMKNAKSIYFTFNVRNYTYKYVLK